MDRETRFGCAWHNFSITTAKLKRSCGMSEPSYEPSSQGPMPSSPITLQDVRTGPPHEGQLGEGVWLQTDRGTIHAIRHPSLEARYGVIWVRGARRGFG